MWLLELLAPRLERARARVAELLSQPDGALIERLGGADVPELTRWHGSFGPEAAQARMTGATTAGLELVCRHEAGFPSALHALGELSPTALSLNGSLTRLNELTRRPLVAIVGTRRASGYGLAAAHAMARDLSAAGLTVVSGLAYGVDSAAHEGAVAGGGRTLAVLAGGPERAYPARKVRLFDAILEQGAVISELGPGTRTWRWALAARNRTIAGLAAITVLIEAPLRSGALITVGHADRFGRRVGALPGPVTSPQSAGPNQLLARHRADRTSVDPTRLRAIRDAQDVLDLIYGEGEVSAPVDPRVAPTPAQAALLARIRDGLDRVSLVDPADLVDLSGLELKGWVTRGAGGTLTPCGR